MRTRVYVAGAYSKPDPESNTRTAIDVGTELLDLGYAPLVPHLSHYWNEIHHRPYEAWMELDLAWVLCADAVLRLSGDSPGADREVELAQQYSIPVFESVEELEACISPHDGQEICYEPVS